MNFGRRRSQACPAMQAILPKVPPPFRLCSTWQRNEYLRLLGRELLSPFEPLLAFVYFLKHSLRLSSRL